METEQRFQQLSSRFEQLQAHNKILESQITQLSTGTTQKNNGKLPSQPEVNPREGVNAIILRSGKELPSIAPEVLDQ